MNTAGFISFTPYALLAFGSVGLLMAGAFARSLSHRVMNLAGAAVAGLAGASALLPRLQINEISGFIAIDGLARIFTATVSFTAAVVLLLSVGYTARRPLGDEEFPSLVLFAAFGMAVLVSTSSLLGVFLGLECMSIALYVLLASNKSDYNSGEAGLKYLVIGAISTAFFAYGLALIYCASGSLSIGPAFSALTRGGGMDPLGMAGWAMLLVGIGFKTSLFPFQFWAPDVYQGGPSPVTAFLSTASKASVFVVLLRFAAASQQGWHVVAPVLWVMAVLTMVFGNIAALKQADIKRLLAYSSIAQMGYVLLAVIASPVSGQAAAVFYLITYIAMELGAFGVIASFSTGAREFGDIERLKGLGYVHPMRAAALAVCFISLAGLPPTAGFMGKFGVFNASLKAEYVGLSVIGLVTAIISVYYYLRVVVNMYMKREDDYPAAGPLVPAHDTSGRLAVWLSVAAVIIFGIIPAGLLDYIDAALK